MSNVDDLVTFQHIYRVIMAQVKYVKVDHGSNFACARARAFHQIEFSFGQVIKKYVEDRSDYNIYIIL